MNALRAVKNVKKFRGYCDKPSEILQDKGKTVRGYLYGWLACIALGTFIGGIKEQPEDSYRKNNPYYNRTRRIDDAMGGMMEGAFYGTILGVVWPISIPVMIIVHTKE